MLFFFFPQMLLDPRSHSLLQHAAGGGRPAAAGAGPRAPADARRRQASDQEHPGEPAEPPGPHRPGGVHAHEPLRTASVNAQKKVKMPPAGCFVFCFVFECIYSESRFSFRVFDQESGWMSTGSHQAEPLTVPGTQRQ